MESLERRLMLAANPSVTGYYGAFTGEGYTLNLAANGTTLNHWSIDWGDGSSPTSACSTATTATHVYTQSGNYQISATAYGSSGDTDPLSTTNFGGLDPTFGGGTGAVTTDLGTASVIAVNNEPNGNVLVLTQNTLMEYNTAGAVVTSFGTDGTKALSALGTATLVGVATSNTTDYIAVGGFTSNSLVIGLYNASGSLIETKSVTTTGSPSVGDVEFSGSEVVLVGSDSVDDTYYNNLLCIWHTSGDPEAFDIDDGLTSVGLYAAAIDPNDSSIWAIGSIGGDYGFIEHFSSTGEIIPPSGSTNSYTPISDSDLDDSIAVRPNGDALLDEVSTSGESELCQFNSDGTLDTSFGDDGLVSGSDVNTQVAAFPGGHLLLASASFGSLSDYNGFGALNSNFGGGGMVDLGMDAQEDYYAFESGGITQLYGGDYELAGWDGTNLDIDFVEPANSVTVAGPNFSAPSSDPTLESGMDSSFALPTDIPAAPDASLDIAASDLSANPGGSLVLTGILEDAAVELYAGTDTPTEYVIGTSSVPVSTSDGLTLTLSSSEPSPSMYLIYAANSSGMGAPVAVNQTDATWIGTAGNSIETPGTLGVVTSSVGDTVSVYGRNLSNGATSPQSWVYLQPSSGTGEWAYVNSVNNYQVNFAVASDLSNGQYQVWINNGLGGDYGWSEAPTPLTVASAMSWPDGYIFNVKYPSEWPDFLGDGVTGAAGDGTTDDAPTIYAALQGIKTIHTDYPDALVTLRFPAGTFLLDDLSDANGDDQMTLGSNTLVLGEGTGLGGTVLDFGVDYYYVYHGATGIHATYEPYAIGFDSGESNVEIDSMSLEFGTTQTLAVDEYGNTGDEQQVEMVEETGGSNLTLNNLILDTSNMGSNNPSERTVDWQGSSFLTLEDSTVISGGVNLIGSNDVAIAGTTFYLGNNIVDPVYIERYTGGGYDFSITGCTVEEVNSGTTDLSGWGQGNFVEDTAYYGNVYNEYVGGNAADDMGAPAAVNEGDFVNVEGAAYAYYGTGILESDDTLWVPCDTPLTGFAVTITGGTGVGQMRVVTSSTSESEDDESGRLLTLNAPWTVSPDDTSTFMVDTMMYNSAFYDNSVSFDATYGQNLSGAAGIEFWMGGYNDVADDNTVEYGKYGVLLASVGGFARYASDEPDSTQFPPLYFVQALNNPISYSSIAGIAYEQLNDHVEEDFIGTIVSGNTISFVTQGTSDDPAQGISLGDGSDSGNPAGRVGQVELSVIEYNSVSDCTGSNAYDIGVYDNAPSVLVYDNTFADSTDPNVPYKGNASATADFVLNNT